jgi:hypothetical protein
MDWDNIDLTSGYEREQDFLTGYSFDTLLLEISCNLRDINEKTVRDHCYNELNNRIREAKEIFEANLNNILKEAIRYRNIE